jgi:hypothetical protein
MKQYCVTILLSVISVICFAQEPWNLKKDQDGIAVYTRKLNNEKYVEIKVVSEFNSTAAELTKILQNIDRHTNWAYNTKKSFLINRKNKDTLTYYSEVSLPWPVSNCDLVIQLCFSQDINPRIMKIQAHSVNNVFPIQPGVVRVPFSLGSWTVTSMDNNRIKIEYILSVNPGGTLPACLVNYTAVTGPFNTFKNLKTLAESKKAR